MLVALLIIGIATICVVLFRRAKQRKDQGELDQHSITVEELHSLLASDQKIHLFDVRQPLDLLAYTEVIPGAQRISPLEVVGNPSIIPQDKEVIVYCTCPSDKTSRMVLGRAVALGFSRIKFLRGGLAAWKSHGYPVEPYRESFHLYNPPVSPPEK